MKKFISEHGESSRPISECVREWQRVDLKDFLGSKIAAGVILSDYILDGSMLDAVPPIVQEAAEQLRGEKMDSLEELVSYIQEKLDAGDIAVLGAVNELKGRIGELLFREQIGDTARLAESVTQEGWDIAVDKGSDGIRYVQVKTTNDPDYVIAEIYKTQEDLLSGVITDGDEVVRQIDFAIPFDIYSAVLDRINQDPALSNVQLIEIESNSEEITSLVEGAFHAYGDESVQHFLGQLVGTTLTAGVLHAAANGFLAYKQAKTAREALRSAVINTAVSGGGLTTGLLAEYSLSAVTTLSGPIGVGVSMLSRSVLSSFVHSRLDIEDQFTRFAEDLERKISMFEVGQVGIRSVSGGPGRGIPL